MMADALFQQEHSRFAALALKPGSTSRESLLEKLQVEFRTEVRFDFGVSLLSLFCSSRDMVSHV